MAACRSPKPLVGVRVPGGVPKFIAGVAQLVEHFLAKEDVDSSNLFTRSTIQGDAMTRKEVIDKAYGSIPKEPLPYFDLDWIPTSRSIRYYLLRLKRFFTR